MAYVPTEWKTGDIVTASKLNKLEEGVANAGGGIAVHSVYNETTGKNVLDKTWQEIYNALAGGKSVCIISGDISDVLMIWCDLIVGADESGYYVSCDRGSTSFDCTSPNEYPEM